MDLPIEGRLDGSSGVVQMMSSVDGAAVGLDVLSRELADRLDVAVLWRADESVAGDVVVDFSAFADAFPDDYWSRAEVRAYPECVLELPDDPACSLPIALGAGLVEADLAAERVSFSTAGVAELLAVSEAEAAVDGPHRSSLVLDASRRDELILSGPSSGDGAEAPEAESETVESEVDPVGPAPGDGSGEAGAGGPEATSNEEGAASAESVAVAPTPGGGGGVVMGLGAGSSGTSGDYGQYPLAQLGEWSSSPGSGNFGWAYPIELPDVPGSLLPDVRLTYASAAVDRMTAGENTQAPYVGLGWDLPIGSISRQYRSCNDDGHSGSAFLCWYSDNATITLNGRSSELVQVGSGSGYTEWRLEDDPGWNVYRYTGAPQDATNPDNDGEYWVVLAPDGTSYMFGAHDDDYYSTSTVPVSGNNVGEPCYGVAYGICQQAYEWRLDVVRDANANFITFEYAEEENVFGGGSGFTYDRAARIKRIEYGKRNVDPAPSTATTPAPAVVYFADQQRTDDYPSDLICPAGPCDEDGPTFFTEHRLSRIDVNVRPESGSAYRLVDQYLLQHHYTPVDPNPPAQAPNPGRMWLDKITRTPYGDETTGGTAMVTEFNGTATSYASVHMANRANPTPPTSVSKMTFWRIGEIIDHALETVIEVDYDQHSVCTSGQLLTSPSPTWDLNDNDCFPSLVGGDWVAFNKWLVRQVVEVTNDGDTSNDVVTFFNYDQDDNDFNDNDEKGAGWAYGGSDIDVKRSWNEWRGYADATVETGKLADANKSRVDYLIYRGLHDDHMLAANSPRVEQLNEPQFGNVYDHDTRVGRVRATHLSESTNGSFDTAVRQIYSYKPITNGNSFYLATTAEYTYAETHTGGWQQTRTERPIAHYDNANRTPTRVISRADNTPSVCTKTTLTSYTNPSSTTPRYFVAPRTTQTYANANCSSSQIGQTESSYDGAAHGAAFTTSTELNLTLERSYDNPNLSVYVDNSYIYDSYGRVKSATDGKGHTTSIWHKHVQGRVSYTRVTNPAGHEERTWISRSRGSTLRHEDANGIDTHYAIDRLGRTIVVHLPVNSTNPPSTDPAVRFTYSFDHGGSGFQRIKTETLHNDGDPYAISYDFFDGLGRLRQQHHPEDSATWNPFLAVSAGTIVTATTYDSAGRVEFQTDTFRTSTTPGSAVTVNNALLSSIPIAYRPTFDGLGRETKTERLNNGSVGATQTVTIDANRERLTDYAGDVLTNFFDARGRLSEIVDGQTNPHYDYDALNRLIEVDDPNVNGTTPETTWTYKSWFIAVEPESWLSLQGEMDDIDRGVSKFANDKNGNTTLTVDGAGRAVAAAYDNLNRPTNASVFLGAAMSEWTYDATGYLGHLESEISHTDHGTFTRTIDSYNLRYQPTTVIWDIPAALGFNDVTYTYTYNDDGTPDSVTHPAVGGLAAETVNHTYDDARRLNTVTSALDTYIAGSYYDGYGRDSWTNYAAGSNPIWRTHSYKADTGWIAGRAATTTPAGGGLPTYVLQQLQYSYDADGTINEIYDTNEDQSECFEHDSASQLTQAWTTNGDCKVSGNPNHTNTGPAPYHNEYTYGANSNLTAVTDHHPQDGTDNLTYQTGNDHFTDTIKHNGVTQHTYTPDNSGNTTTHTTAGTTTTHTYNVLNRLTSITDGTDTTEFSYDTAGQRLMREDPDGTQTLYLPGLELIDPAGGGSITATRLYTANGAAFATRNNAGDLQWTLGDHHGSATLVIDDNPGAAANPNWTYRRYLPYGDIRHEASTGTPNSQQTDARFLNQTLDQSSGLTYLNARYYNATTRLFSQPDRIRQETRPAASNAYGYSLNSPASLSDASGDCALDGTASRECWEAYARHVADRQTAAFVEDLELQYGVVATPKDIGLVAGTAIAAVLAAVAPLVGDLFSSGWDLPVIRDHPAAGRDGAVVDTSALIQLTHDPVFRARLEAQLGGRQPIVAPQSLLELDNGVNFADLTRLAQWFEIMSWLHSHQGRVGAPSTDAHANQLRAAVASQDSKRNPGANDLHIAATAQLEGVALVTADGPQHRWFTLIGGNSEYVAP